jgi:hypothetical protein
MAGPVHPCPYCLYVVVGRRLGYPLKLVEAKDHLYCRWDDTLGTSFPKERFNIEGSGQGFGMYPDDYYLGWPLQLTVAERQMGVYGKSLTPREELACFLGTRGHCLADNGREAEAIQCFQWTIELAPHDPRYKLQLRSYVNRNKGRYYIPPRSPFPPNKTVKVALGTPLPADLPPGTPIKYVPASEADPAPDWRPEPGRVYKIAAGRPIPSCLPPGTPMQAVPPDQADDLLAIRRAAAATNALANYRRPAQPGTGCQPHRSGIHEVGHIGPHPSWGIGIEETDYLSDNP